MGHPDRTRPFRLHDEVMVVAQVTETTVDEEERTRNLGQVRSVEQQRRELLARLLTVQDEERRRIAVDVHDDLIQEIAALMFWAEMLVRRRPELKGDESFLALERGLAGSMSRLRHLIFELHPYTLESEGLEVTLMAHIEALGGLPEAPVYDLHSKLTREPSPEMRATFYRIAREAIANARRHSEATHVHVTLEEEQGGFLLQIEDDGIGFRAEAKNNVPPGHLGLRSMCERAELVGGWCRFESVPGEGTRVVSWLPDDGPTKGDGSVGPSPSSLRSRTRPT